MGDPKPIREIRLRIIRLAEGTVLEIGAGSGANFVHYDRARVSKLYALEPNPGMIRFAERQRHRTQLDVEYLDLPGERIPLEGRGVDSIVSTFTLGTIPDALEARKYQVCGCLDCSSLAWCEELGVTLLFKASFTNPCSGWDCGELREIRSGHRMTVKRGKK